MYIPSHFAETDPGYLAHLIREHPFGLLITQSEDGMQASHLPLQYEPERGANGTLVAHMARANPQWQVFGESEVLVVFSGPHAYISPRWYTTPVNVPTWNYVAVHAYGVPQVLDDPRECLNNLVTEIEQVAEQPWSMETMPEDYLSKLVAHVVAFEIPVSRLEGKAKLGQNRPPVDRLSAIEGLRETGDAMAAQVANLMEKANA